MIGQRLDGKYELLRLIDDSGVGAIYEGQDPDGVRCVVKVARRDVRASDADLARFEREVTAAKALASPHCVKILASGRDSASGRLYAVTELLDGESAGQILKRMGPLRPQLAIRIGVQACEALAVVHESLVHGDIRLAKLFLTENGVVKLLGLGLSALGPPPPASERHADLWSLGTTLHQLLTGGPPHTDVGEPAALVTEAAPWVSSRLAAVIAGALRPAVSERYPSAEQLGDALCECLEGDARVTSVLMLPLTEDERHPPDTVTPKTAPMPVVSLEAPPPVPEKPPPAKPPAAKSVKPAVRAGTPKTVPIAVVPEPPKAAFIPLDATIALNEPLAPAEDPRPPPAPKDPLAATVALSSFELPPVLEPKAEPPPPSRAVPSKRPAEIKPVEDAGALARHNEARRAAIASARLPAGDAPPQRGLLLWILVGSGALVFTAVALYFLLRESSPESTTEPATVPITETTAPEASPEPPPDPEPSVAQPEAGGPSAAPSASAAPSGTAAEGKTYRMTVTPPYAAISVDSVPVRTKDGQFDIVGNVGETRVVIVKVPGRSPMLVKVKITETGPEPSTIVGPPARISGRR